MAYFLSAPTEGQKILDLSSNLCDWLLTRVWLYFLIKLISPFLFMGETLNNIMDNRDDNSIILYLLGYFDCWFRTSDVAKTGRTEGDQGGYSYWCLYETKEKGRDFTVQVKWSFGELSLHLSLGSKEHKRRIWLAIIEKVKRVSNNCNNF